MERSRPANGIDQARLAPEPSKCAAADAALSSSKTTSWLDEAANVLAARQP